MLVVVERRNLVLLETQEEREELTASRTSVCCLSTLSASPFNPNSPHFPLVIDSSFFYSNMSAKIFFESLNEGERGEDDLASFGMPNLSLFVLLFSPAPLRSEKDARVRAFPCWLEW